MANTKARACSEDVVNSIIIIIALNNNPGKGVPPISNTLSATHSGLAAIAMSTLHPCLPHVTYDGNHIYENQELVHWLT